MKVGEASLLMGANAAGASAELFDKEIQDFSIDSRSVGAGELFFALSQEDYARAGFNGTFADAHQYIEDALAKGSVDDAVKALDLEPTSDIQATGDVKKHLAGVLLRRDAAQLAEAHERSA